MNYLQNLQLTLIKELKLLRKSSWSLGLNFLDAPDQGASFYIERIDLALRLREIGLKWRCSRSFSGKSPSQIF